MFFWNKKPKEGEKTGFAVLLDTLKIKEQIERQQNILKNLGIAQTLTDGKSQGIVGIDNKEYVMPTVEEILQRMENKKELLEKKMSQGFTKIIIVPFAWPLEKIIKRYEDVVVTHHNSGTLLATKELDSEKDTSLDLDPTHPINIWNECKDADVKNTFIYFPKIYDRANHYGKTKTELLLNPQNAWQVFLVEDMPNIPMEGKGKTIGHRRQLETNRAPKKYLEILQKDKMYQGEEGLTTEGSLFYAITHLEETNQVINDWQGKGNVSCDLSTLIIPSNNLPCLSWNRDFNRTDLWKLSVDTTDPQTGPRIGIRI